MHKCAVVGLACCLLLGSCSVAQQEKIKKIETVVIQYEKDHQVLFHAGITLLVGEFLRQHPESRPAIIKVSQRLLDALTSAASGDPAMILAMARTKILAMDLPPREREAFDLFLQVIAPPVFALAKRYAPQGDPLQVEQQLLAWIHDAAVVAEPSLAATMPIR